MARSVVVADGAASRSAEKGVVTGEVPGDAADDGASDTATGFGGSGRANASQRERHYQCNCLHESSPRV